MGICFLLLIVGVCWAQYNPNTQAGRTSIVHLFEWRWADIALECERYLAPNGFGGVQISPPNENVIVADPWHPWWERYQPVSYKLCTRSGNETEFRDMVTRCNSVGVHIYVDAVINHMCGGTAGAGNHSTCGSYFNAKTEDFPAVPYSAWDFNDGKCKSESGDIENYHDASQVRNCRLVNLLDLALEKDYVRSKVAEYLNYLIDIGVAGFRIDAAKHMWPEDVKAILDKLKDLNTKWFSAGAKPFIYQEVSPPNENIVITNPFRPWWERYQPISYKLCSRSGNENEFRDMVTRCNNVGVYIYVDAVVNHMCGAAGGSGTHSTCGSYFDAGNENFPAVPYSGWDFNDGKCHTSNGEIQNYGDMYQVRDCRLSGLLDLAQEKDYVRSKVAEYMNYLIDIGVAGFRIDAAKHMWPGDIKAFLDKLNTLNTRWFPSGTKPFIYQEVIDLGGEPITGSQYYGNGRVTEFKYGAKLGTVIRKWNGEKMAYLKNWGEGWGFAPSDRALVFVDNHDNQRGHGAGGASILTFWDARLYKMAVGFMLAHPYGFTRVMSSYRWTRNFVNGKDANDWIGPPSNSDGSTKSVTINADTTCGNDWVCEHRWRQIRNMVIFRNVADGQPFSNWWDNGSNQVAFGRGNKGFIVFNNDDWYMNVNLQTGLPAGTYCDVISGQKEGNACTGKQVYVSGDGTANFQISNTDEDPFVAIHVDAKL